MAEKSATSRSKRLGRVRAAISAVTVCRGDKVTTNPANNMEIIVPRTIAFPLAFNQAESPTARANPAPIIGPISGERSIAPITTAGEESSKPRIAMPADIEVMNAKWGVKPLSSRTLSITVC